MLSIGITTFKRRFEIFKNLVQSIRNIDEDINIIVTVNADYKEPFDEEYRKNLLELFSETKNCYPVFFPEFTSLSKMWNTLIVHSPEDHILILNDDIELTSNTVLEELKKLIKNHEKTKIKPVEDLFIINHSWAHFVISKQIAHELKYFDERLLAFGEEDGDMYWRFIKKYGFAPRNIDIKGLKNIQEGFDVKIKNMESQCLCGSQRPKFNTNWIYSKKFKKAFWGIKGMFNYKVVCINKTLQQYPYEKFKKENIDKLFSKITNHL